MMPAGKYFIGDLSKVVNTQLWSDIDDILCKDMYDGGEYILHNNIRFACYPTKGNSFGADGCFASEYANYEVDSGTLGCILVSDINIKNCDTTCGDIVDFNEPFNTSEHAGTITIGHIIIETDLNNDSDDDIYNEIDEE